VSSSGGRSLRERVREKSGRKKTPSLVCIDSQSVKEDVNLEDKGIDGNKKVKGRKPHIVVDILGLLLFYSITAANVSDIHPGKGFISDLLYSIFHMNTVFSPLDFITFSKLNIFFIKVLVLIWNRRR
jgi:hypothetical protein